MQSDEKAVGRIIWPNETTKHSKNWKEEGKDEVYQEDTKPQQTKVYRHEYTVNL